MNDFSLASMLKQGWPILSILMVMSVFSMATFIDRLRALRRTRCNARQFVRYVIRVIEERGLDAAVTYCAKHQVPAARASLAVLEEIRGQDLAANARRQEARIRQTIGSWQLPVITAVRGLGLLLGIGLDPTRIAAPAGRTPALFVVDRLMEKGLLVPPAGPNTIRLLPPLNVTDAEIDEALAIVHAVLATF